MRFNLRFILFAVIPYMAGMSAIWSGVLIQSSRFAAALTCSLTIVWAFVTCLGYLFVESMYDRRKAEDERAESVEGTKGEGRLD